MTRIEFDQIRLDALKEISSMATGHAATSLSTMLGKRVDITVPNIMVEALTNIPQILGGGEKISTVVHFSMSGQVSGSAFLLLSLSESVKIANALTGQRQDETEGLDEMGESALKELGNIVTGSFIRVLAEGLKLKIVYSAPGFAHDMLGATLDGVLAQLSLDTEYAVVMESEFIVRGEIYRGHLVFILAPEAVGTIIQALGAWKKPDQTTVESGSLRDSQISHELMDVFHEETRELIQEMRKDLSVLSEGLKSEDEPPEECSSILKRLYRHAHIIKSSSGSAGYHELRELALLLERTFRTAHGDRLKITADVSTLLSECVEACQKMLDSEEVAGYKELLARLDGISVA